MLRKNWRAKGRRTVFFSLGDVDRPKREADRKKKKKQREGNLPNLDGFYKKGSFLEHSTENRLFFLLMRPKKASLFPLPEHSNFRST